jgi:mannitol-1-/sugar-/sorbitol-6-phosphatase
MSLGRQDWLLWKNTQKGESPSMPQGSSTPNLSQPRDSGKSTTVHCSALLFDLDGVLIDSTPAVARVWARWALERGFDPEQVVARAHGRPSLTTVKELLPNADHETENKRVERAEIEDLEGVVPLPGTLDLLASLPRDRWTIVTSCTRALAEVRIRAAGLPLPENFITSTDIVNGKPHPEPYLKGASVLGFPAAECIVLEDAPAGIRAGKAAQAVVIAFRTTAPDAALRTAGADWILNDCSDIRLAGSPILSAHSQLALCLSLSEQR